MYNVAGCSSSVLAEYFLMLQIDMSLEASSSGFVRAAGFSITTSHRKQKAACERFSVRDMCNDGTWACSACIRRKETSKETSQSKVAISLPSC